MTSANVPVDTAFDDMIVSTGSAGCVFTNRRSAGPHSVLLRVADASVFSPSPSSNTHIPAVRGGMTSITGA